MEKKTMSENVEVFLKRDEKGERLIIACPNCGIEYVPNAGFVSKCPSCQKIFTPSFDEVGKELIFDQDRWLRLLRGCADSPVKLIRLDGGPRDVKFQNGKKLDELN
jgi:hypothetical protein